MVWQKTVIDGNNHYSYSDLQTSYLVIASESKILEVRANSKNGRFRHYRLDPSGHVTEVRTLRSTYTHLPSNLHLQRAVCDLFTSLSHLIDPQNLESCIYSLEGN